MALTSATAGLHSGDTMVRRSAGNMHSVGEDRTPSACETQDNTREKGWRRSVVYARPPRLDARRPQSAPPVGVHCSGAGQCFSAGEKQGGENKSDEGQTLLTTKLNLNLRPVGPHFTLTYELKSLSGGVKLLTGELNSPKWGSSSF